MPILVVIIGTTVSSVLTYIAGYKAGKAAAYDDVELMAKAMVEGFFIGYDGPSVKKGES